jgi:NADH-quinone oxidoreductase subunit J
MILATLAFYLFAGICVLSGAMVVFSRNPVHSVLWLILAFFNAAGLFVLLGAEFLALILVIVYVGAVAVLFLFVVMMLDVDLAGVKRALQRHVVVGAAVGLLMLGELLTIAGSWIAMPSRAVTVAALATPASMTNTEALGTLLYTRYVYAFQSAGLVLLVAMIGAIVLTQRRRKDVQRQSVPGQIARTRTVRAVKVTPGDGI